MKEKERVVLLGLILKRISDFNINTFEGRLILQKSIYLLQSLGLYLGYKFSWYIHGPYSPDLTRNAFALQPIYDNVPTVKFSDAKIEHEIEKFEKFVGKQRNDGDWLEQLACAHFLKALDPKADRESIVKAVLYHEHHFRRKDCEEAWDYLRQQKLLEKEQS